MRAQLDRNDCDDEKQASNGAVLYRLDLKFQTMRSLVLFIFHKYILLFLAIVVFLFSRCVRVCFCILPFFGTASFSFLSPLLIYCDCDALAILVLSTASSSCSLATSSFRRCFLICVCKR